MKNVKDSIRGELSNFKSLLSTCSKDAQAGHTRNYLAATNAYKKFEIAYRLSLQISDKITDTARKLFDKIESEGRDLSDIALSSMAKPESRFIVIDRISSLISDTNMLLDILDEDPTITRERSLPLKWNQWADVFSMSRAALRKIRDSENPAYHFRKISVNARRWTLPLSEIPAEYLMKYRKVTS